MPAQWFDWTCSACSCEWIERALGFARGSDIFVNREEVVYAIGYPNNISPALGLHDASGAQLQRVLLESTGRESESGYLDFDTVYDLVQETQALMSGAKWYHWVACRGAADGLLLIANSAPGYKGIHSTLSREQFNALGGFSVVWLR